MLLVQYLLVGLVCKQSFISCSVWFFYSSYVFISHICTEKYWVIAKTNVEFRVSNDNILFEVLWAHQMSVVIVVFSEPNQAHNNFRTGFDQVYKLIPENRYPTQMSLWNKSLFCPITWVTFLNIACGPILGKNL